MAHIEVDFEVWKALTALRDAEEQTYNDVIRRMLKLPSISGSSAQQLTATMILQSTGRVLGGRHLPDGTILRSTYKGDLYRAEISGGKLIGEGGKAYKSASAAARAVTQTNVNGLAFWEVKRPHDSEWQKLMALPRQKP